jgi:hypothetical protein
MLIPLKYKLDRKTLETMYTTFVRPTMEYSIIVWGGTYDTTLSKLEQLNIKAMRIISGAIANSNITKLRNETSICSISERRDAAMLKMFYKIKNNLAPNYLHELIPPERHEIIQYALRNNTTIQPPFARLETLKRSFIPCAIKLWNSLPIATRNTNNLSQFKQLISKASNKNILYYYGKRWSNIHHARLRMGCSGLNFDLYTNVHVVNSPICECGNGPETAQHYLMSCPNFNNQRDALRSAVVQLCDFNFDILLYGNENLEYNENCLVFDAVHKFIEDTNRFI